MYRESPQTQPPQNFVAKKQRLGLNFGGLVDKFAVADTYEPFIDDLQAMVLAHLQQHKKYPHT